MKIELCKYKNNADCAFSFTFDDGCYLDSSKNALEIFENIYNSFGLKIKATVGITVNFMHERLVNFWNDAIKRGYFDIASHTIGHDIAFSSETPFQKRDFDAKESQRLLREMFAQPVNTFIFAGGKRDAAGASVLGEYYFACRGGDEGVNFHGEIDWLFIKCLTAMLKKPLEYYTDYIDKTINEGAWGIQMNHWLTEKEEDVFHSQNLEQFRKECLYLANKSTENKIWTGSFEEVGAYIRKYEACDLSVKEIDGALSVSLVPKCNLKEAILDTPLTVLVESDKDILVFLESGESKRISPDENGKILLDVKKCVEFEIIEN